MSGRGLFITVEGAEGVGKSTNMGFIAELLDQRGIDYVLTREPGGTPLAEDVRELLLQPRNEPVAEMTELLLVFAARAQHLHSLIQPALDKGQWVLCDRFTDATFAYQGAGRGLSIATIEKLQDMVQGALRPDCTVLLDAPVAVGMQRANKRSAPDRFESEKEAFFERVRQSYLAQAAAAPQRYRVVDAAADLTQVQLQIRELLEPLLDERGAGRG